MTNYINAPYAVALFWCIKTGIEMLPSADCVQQWSDAIATPSGSDLLQLTADLILTSSPLVSTLLRDPSMTGLHAVQHLAMFQRGLVTVKLNDFIYTSSLICATHKCIVGQVVEMVEAFLATKSVIRIRLEKVRVVESLDSSRGGVITLNASDPCVDCMPVCIEDCVVSELHTWLDLTTGQYTFTY